MLMLMLWITARGYTGVTHFIAYHRSPDGHFYAFSNTKNNIWMRLCCWQWIGFIWRPHLPNGRRTPTVFVRLCIPYLYCLYSVFVLFVMGTITILVSSQLPVMWQRAASNRSQSDETPRLRGAGFLLLIKTTDRHHHHHHHHHHHKRS